MSGKSTLLRQIALLHIMAQVRTICFRSSLTPADCMTYRLDAMSLLCTPLSSLLTPCFLAWAMMIRSKEAFLSVPTLTS